MSIRKRKPGERKPSTRLNEVVNHTPPPVLADLQSLFVQNGQVPAYWRLAMWQLGRMPDPDGERQAFEGFKLASLRNEALRKIGAGLDFLHSRAPHAHAAGVATNNARPVHDGLPEARRQAFQRGYLGRFREIVAMERDHLSGLGKDAGARLRLDQELALAETCIAVGERIKDRKESLAEFKSRFIRSGVSVIGAGDEVRKPSFDHSMADGLPPTLVCAEWEAEEAIAYLDGDYALASEYAVRILDICRRHQVLGIAQHAKLLRRLSLYCAELRDHGKAIRMLQYFREVEPEKEEHREWYLRKYLIALLAISFDLDEESLLEEARHLIERNRAYLLRKSLDKDQPLLHLLIITHHIRLQEIQLAKEVLSLMLQSKFNKDRPLYFCQSLLAHLALLYEANDATALKGASRNYERQLKKFLPFAVPTLAVIQFMKRQIGVSSQLKFDSYRNDMIETLRKYSKSPTHHASLWYQPVMDWIQRARIRDRQSQL